MRVRVVVSAIATTGGLLLGPLGVPSPAVAATATCNGFGHDIDGDGHDDVVVGDSAADVGSAAGAGRIEVRYGVGVGEAPRTVTLTQASTGILGTATAGDHFGAAVAIGNIDGDTCADVVIGVPGEDLGAAVDAGVAQVVYGSPAGLGLGRAGLTLGRGLAGMPGSPAAGEAFGSAVAVARKTVDEPAVAVAAGAPGAASGAGAVGVIDVLADGSTANAHALVQGTNGVPDVSEAGDSFGTALAFGYFVDGSTAGYVQDLLVGTPGENAAAGAAITVSDAGSPGPYTGAAWSQNSAGVDGTAEAGDAFGSSLSFLMNEFTGERYLAIGAPREDIGTAKDAGTVHRFRFPAALVGTNEVAISQGANGVMGSAETGDRFGTSVSVQEYHTDAYHFGLAVGAPLEDVGTAKDAGGVGFYDVLTSTPGASDVFLTETSSGVPGAAQAADHLAAALGGSSAGLLAGAPNDGGSRRGVVLVLPWELVSGRSAVSGTSWAPAAGTHYGAAIA